MNINVSLVQFAPKLGAVKDNLAAHLAAIESAVAAGADLVVFPELSLTGYFLKELAADVALDPVRDKTIGKLAKASTRISIVAGFVERDEFGFLYNAAAFFEDGEIADIHRKVYLPTYGMFDEGRYIKEGRRFDAIRSRLGFFAILICEDMWHPSASYIARLKGAQTIICPSASPLRGIEEARPGIERDWEAIIRVNARLYGMNVVYANRVGFEDGIGFWGGSRIVTPDGVDQVKLPLIDEATGIGIIDDGIAQRAAITTPNFSDRDRMITTAELAAIEREERW